MFWFDSKENCAICISEVVYESKTHLVVKFSFTLDESDKVEYEALELDRTKAILKTEVYDFIPEGAQTLQEYIFTKKIQFIDEVLTGYRDICDTDIFRMYDEYRFTLSTGAERFQAAFATVYNHRADFMIQIDEAGVCKSYIPSFNPDQGRSHLAQIGRKLPSQFQLTIYSGSPQTNEELSTLLNNIGVFPSRDVCHIIASFTQPIFLQGLEVTNSLAKWGVY